MKKKKEKFKNMIWSFGKICYIGWKKKSKIMKKVNKKVRNISKIPTSLIFPTLTVFMCAF